MTETNEDIQITPGRPVRLADTPPGGSVLVLGIVIAGLAPLLGFLVGALSGEAPGEGLFTPIYWGLFVGVMIGALGVAMAVVGGWRLWRHTSGARTAPREPVHDTGEA